MESAQGRKAERQASLTDQLIIDSFVLRSSRLALNFKRLQPNAANVKHLSLTVSNGIYELLTCGHESVQRTLLFRFHRSQSRAPEGGVAAGRPCGHTIVWLVGGSVRQSDSQ